jgi:hypothetical protein
MQGYFTTLMQAIEANRSSLPKVVNSFDEDEKRAKELANKEKETDIALKEKYGNTILGILIAWLSFVGLLLLAKYGPNGSKLSDGILITLITTTTLDILILPKIVLQHLFPQKDKRED